MWQLEILLLTCIVLVHNEDVSAKSCSEKLLPTRYRAFNNYKVRMRKKYDQGMKGHDGGLYNTNMIYDNLKKNPTSSNCKSRTEDLLQYLQVDDLDSGKYDTLRNLPNNSCARPCVEGKTLICYYEFSLEPYTTLGKACNDCLTNSNDCYNKGCVTADGVEKAILTVNRRMPAPSIQVCEGDQIVVDVHNMMPGRSTTIHWHGFRQKDSKFMDGVPMVTQCPILESQTFRYSFLAEEAGMSFYHSHDGLQKVDGLVGSLVVRQPRKKDPNHKLYDYDLPSHVIVVQDWYHLTADSMFPGLRYKDNVHKAASYLIQGRGQRILSNGTVVTNTPLAVFKVTHGKRYLFHIVAGTCYECQYFIKFEQHNLTIVGADVRSTEPYTVESITMSPGERYSIVVDCNQDVASYWISVATGGFCKDMESYQLAILKYKGSSGLPNSIRPTYDSISTNGPGLTLSPINSKCTAETRYTEGPCIQDLRSRSLAPREILNMQPDFRMVWGLGFYFHKEDDLYNSPNFHKFIQVPNLLLASTINGVVFKFPPAPLLSQRNDIPCNNFCPTHGYDMESWNEHYRECTYVTKVPVNSVIEIIAMDMAEHDADGISHVMHLHGYHMYMCEQGLLDQDVPFNESYYQLIQYLNSNKRKKIPIDVVTKDTFPVTAGGFVVLKVLLDNPGYWYYHCHFAYHLDSGMSGVLQVGDPKTFPKPPHNFPTCKNFLTFPYY